jgi:hypothetical protein
MARVMKLRETADAAPEPEQPVNPNSQRKRPETGRYLLQVDRQTKASYPTAEAAETAGLAIKTGHPIVQVSIYDSVDCQNRLVELPATAG